MNKDQYWLNICNAVSDNSKCLSRHIGAVIVKDNKFIVSTGYNGPPSGCRHCNTRNGFEYNSVVLDMLYSTNTCPRKSAGYSSGEGIEFCPAAHAERNAISIAAKLGYPTDGCSMYMNCPIPCFECAKSIINAGIKEIIVTEYTDYENKGIRGKDLFRQAGVKIRVYNLK